MQLSFDKVILPFVTLCDIGIDTSPDEYVKGYFSFRTAHALPFDAIKIDRSFINDIHSNPASKNIVRSVIPLCRDTGLSCVVEGVETDEQLRIVKQLGATVIQGFLFSEPMAMGEVSGYLSQEPNRLANL